MVTPAYANKVLDTEVLMVIIGENKHKTNKMVKICFYIILIIIPIWLLFYCLYI